jgi:hypothetical protein
VSANLRFVVVKFFPAFLYALALGKAPGYSRLDFPRNRINSVSPSME